jgi:hypothetical protein
VIVAGASGGGDTLNNTTAAQYLSETGVAFPIYDNVIQYSDAGGIYLGYNAATHDVWVLTARHINTDASAGATVTIGGQVYDRQPEGTDGYGDLVGGDLRLVRYQRTDLGVPSLPSVTLASAAPTAGTQVTMVGYGQNRVQAATTNKNTSDAVAVGGSSTGYQWSGTNIKRWGINNIEANSLEGTFSLGSYTTVGFVTRFDQPGTNQWLSTNEAQGSLGDSGGGAFTYSGGHWYLTGTFSGVSNNTGQDANTAAFGNYTVFTDISTYNAAIQSTIGVTLVPEPSTALLSAAGVAVLLSRRRRGLLTAAHRSEIRNLTS